MGVAAMGIDVKDISYAWGSYYLRIYMCIQATMGASLKKNSGILLHKITNMIISTCWQSSRKERGERRGAGYVGRVQCGGGRRKG